MQDDQFNDDSPFAATFRVEIDGQEAGHFRQVSGLEIHIAVEEIPEGGQNHFVHKVPGRMSWPNIVLSRGVTQNDVLLEWLMKSSGDGYAGNQNKLERCTAAIVMTSLNGENDLRAWDFYGVFPVRWKGPQFASDSSEYLVEELEFAHQGFQVNQSP